MPALALPDAARVAEAAADAARGEIVPRFRNVSVETKGDGSPVTEADLAAERAIRAVLREATPEIGILGEEYGEEGAVEGRTWLVDPIDGTLSFSRGIPLFGTLIALLEDGVPVLGLIDLHALGERTVGWQGGGVRCNGRPVRVSTRTDLAEAIVAHGDPYCFDLFGDRPAWEKLAQNLRCLRGYTDCFGQSQVISGTVDAMVDLCLQSWDAAPALLLVREAGGRAALLDRGPEHAYRFGMVAGSPPLVEQLLDYVATAPSDDLRVLGR
jgi:inositol-phosphate phosphatase/L-galactose 1-phosphate phosphatase/histidinol-phosphatase